MCSTAMFFILFDMFIIHGRGQLRLWRNVWRLHTLKMNRSADLRRALDRENVSAKPDVSLNLPTQIKALIKRQNVVPNMTVHYETVGETGDASIHFSVFVQREFFADTREAA